jgi:hypothetical protein
VLSAQARRFAVLWGIIVVEPDRIPLPLLHYLSGRAIDNLRYVSLLEQDEIWEEMPLLLTSLQSRLGRAASIFAGNEPLLGAGRIDRALNYLQREVGDHYWNALDSKDPNWLEKRFESIADRAELDL